MRSLFAALLLALMASPLQAAEHEPRLIWGSIPIVKSADYAEFEAELSRTRAQARRELLGDFAALLIPMAGSTDDIVRLAQVLASTVERFDTLARRHAVEAHQGIGLALQEDFKSGVQRILDAHRLGDTERRIGFAFASRDDLVALERKPVPISEALRTARDLRYLAYGSYVVVDRSLVRAVLHVEDLRTARVRSFSAQGPIAELGERLAQRVVDALQGVEFPGWENPQAHLTWIAPAAPVARVRADVAARYCQGQRARLPYTSELLQAAMGGPYREGGIGPLIRDSFYIVADRNRHDEQHYYSTRDDAQWQTGGPVVTDAGLGGVTGYYWCVRGEPSRETLMDQALYRQLREQRERRRDDLALALEYVLASRNDPGTRPVEAFSSLSAALRFLADNGVHLQIH